MTQKSGIKTSLQRAEGGNLPRAQRLPITVRNISRLVASGETFLNESLRLLTLEPCIRRHLTTLSTNQVTPSTRLTQK